MHICKSSENCTGKEKKSISQNKEYHDNAKVKKLAVFRNKTFELRNRSTSQHSMANYSNLVYTFVKNNIFENQF